MKAVRIHSHGDVDVLCIDNISEPKCLNNTVKVQVKASALNHLDIWVRGGLPSRELVRNSDYVRRMQEKTV